MLAFFLAIALSLHPLTTPSQQFTNAMPLSSRKRPRSAPPALPKSSATSSSSWKLLFIFLPSILAFSTSSVSSSRPGLSTALLSPSSPPPSRQRQGQQLPARSCWQPLQAKKKNNQDNEQASTSSQKKNNVGRGDGSLYESDPRAYRKMRQRQDYSVAKQEVHLTVIS